ncbi:ATP dependent RNA helicase, putative [Talaromyces stipitatus ATCC 10500]|uniref:RNA helicase n=1 Tax=Talaromyces stipitatus (strain ATCC 10500 / CBS 375.48 / QM 6759 / NRRL 1006) TaxID=441959 RepID=B8M1C8_TALSN|nr:ATP dependent RNA helicase, putative [Talaromyces stipitatus ATCC 10500]EED21824.1 ATP dependent RNA helicase, putative [Talaromyces stipitatus ATCC 10500]
MPPNKRKKKPASNPARGFATVSVPSKPKVAESSTVSSTVDSSVVVSEDEKSSKQPETQRPQTDSSKDQTLQTLSPEELERHFEEAELQILVDKYGWKSKNEASRQVFKFETERRVLRSQANVLSLNEWIPQKIQDQVLALAQLEQDHLDAPPEGDLDAGKEEELITRLWSLKDAIRGLGFSDSRVDSLLRHIITYYSGVSNSSKNVNWNLEESLEWLALQCDPTELDPYDKKKDPSWTPEEAASSFIGSENKKSPSNPSLAAQAGNPLNKPPSSRTIIEVEPNLGNESDSSLDPEDFADEYVSLKTQIYQLSPQLFDQNSGGGRKGRAQAPKDVSDPRIKKLQLKVAKIESDILFDHDAAEMKWREKLNDLRREFTFNREKGRAVPVAKNVPSKESQPTISEDTEEFVMVEASESGDELLLGGIFIEPDEPLLVRDTPDSIKVIRNFAESVGGTEPDKLLQEVCKARDPGFKVVLRDLAVASFYNRKGIEIKWSKPQEEPVPLSIEGITIKSNAFTVFVSMDSIAAAKDEQAKGYISTLALFLVSAPASNNKENKAYMRLPNVWREVYQEFSDLRKQQEDESDKQTIRYLKKLIEENHGKLERDVVLSDNFKRRNGNNRQQLPGKTESTTPKIDADSLRKLWEEKMNTTSFQHMTESRKNLPVWAYKQQILDTLANHQAVIICSETGSGKSTQIPSFIMENELASGRECKVFVTEPRRISAISLARRVSEELGERHQDLGTNRSLVGYAIRLESKISQSTRLIFATTGVVVRMLERPNEMQDITHIVLDEVHERSIDSDFLLIVLRRLLAQRPELKVVLMSATVDAKKFANYLGGVPVLNIPGRTFPVQVKYLEDAIHLTNYRLDDSYPASTIIDEDEDDKSSDEGLTDEMGRGLRATLEGYPYQTRDTVLKFDEYRLDYRLITRLLTAIATRQDLSQYSKAILVFLPGLAEIRRLHDEIGSDSTFNQGWIIHTLHSSIASEDQEKAFLVPPEGTRKIVIATNIAETGITIPDITAVIDAGKEKVMRFDEKRQLSRLVESFISRANAKQRRGRAGRVQKGICFHLFTEYRHDNKLSEQQTPEMLRLSLQDLVLRVKICNLGEVENTLLEAMDPPSSKNIRRAIESLKEVKALTSAEGLTALGKQLAKLPLDVWLGKLIIYGAIFKCLDACVSIAAILSSKSPFVNTIGSNSQRDAARLSFKRGDSDLLTIYNAYLAWKKIRETPGVNEYTFCRKNFLSPQSLLNIEDIKTQLLVSIVDAGLLKLEAEEQTALRRARVTGRNRQFFVIPERVNVNSANDLIVNSVIAWSFYPKLVTREGKGWRNVVNNQNISLHPISVNKQVDSSVQWLSYYHIMQTRNRYYNAHETSAVESFAVALLCGDAEFKMYSGIISIDNNRIRFSVRDWKQMLAFKRFSIRVREIMTEIVRNPQKMLSRRQREWMEIWQQIFFGKAAKAAEKK